MVIYLLRSNILWVPPLQARQADQVVVGAYHAQHMCSGILPSILNKLLKPASRALCFFNWTKILRTRLVLKKLWADKVKHWGHTFLVLEAFILPQIPVLDQILEMLLSIKFQHCTKDKKEVASLSKDKESSST